MDGADFFADRQIGFENGIQSHPLPVSVQVQVPVGIAHDQGLVRLGIT